MALQRGLAGAARQRQPLACARHRRGSGQPQGDELRRGAGRRAAEQRAVGGLESGLHTGFGQRLGQGQGDLAALADITHVGEAAKAARRDLRPGFRQHCHRLRLQRREDLRRRIEVGAYQRCAEARGPVDAGGRHQHPDGAAGTGARRADDAGDAQLAGEVPGVDGGGTTGRQ
jgi:hypothetical protein